MAGLGMDPERLELDVGAWRTEGTRKGRGDDGRRDAAAGISPARSRQWSCCRRAGPITPPRFSKGYKLTSDFYVP
jgi:hypothetical protein